ncbi:AMP-binding enzyme [Colletotrichum tofieldiae]|nr:AMP-binding enzyme [Colletotrichum tofieldiae]
MPVNANGKIDRRELTRKAQAAPVSKPSSERVEPRNEVEEALCEEFAEVLGVATGITDNFFNLGGQSLMAAKLASRISRRLDIHVSVKDIFDKPAPADLASKILQTMLEGANSRTSVLVDSEPFKLLSQEDPESFVKREIAPQIDPSYGRILDSYPVLWTQRIFVQDAITGQPRPPALFLVDFPAGSDPRKVADSSAALVQHFDIFRTVFLPASGKFYQVVLDRLEVPTKIVQVEGDMASATSALVDPAAYEPLRFGHAFLRITILKKEGSPVRMVLLMNHAIYDGLSLQHVLRALHSLHNGERLPTPPKFSRFVQHMMNVRKDGYKFWRSVLEKSSMTFMRGADGTGRHHRDEGQQRPNGVWLSEKVIKAPFQANADGITPATVFTTACALMFGKELGLNDVVFGRVVSGRQCLPNSSQHIVGPCSNAVPVRVSLDATARPRELLRKVQEQYVNSLPFEALGLDDIRDNCTDWPETVDNFSCYSAYQNFDMHPHTGGDDQRIQLGYLEQPEASKESPTLLRHSSNVVSMHDVDVAGMPDADGIHLRVVVGVNRRLCDEATVDNMLLDLCDKIQSLARSYRTRCPRLRTEVRSKRPPPTRSKHPTAARNTYSTAKQSIHTLETRTDIE